MSKNFCSFLLQNSVRGSVEKLSHCLIKELNVPFSFSIFQDIFYFFGLDLEENDLTEKYRIFASTILHYYSYKEILFKDWCRIVFLIIKSFIKNLYLNINFINKVNRNNSVSYKISLEVIDLLRDASNY